VLKKTSTGKRNLRMGLWREEKIRPVRSRLFPFMLERDRKMEEKLEEGVGFTFVSPVF